ncbi:MAG: MliC family protein [Rhodospirillaceae bacterium]|nr:MliC family protein [Rhodospirillaceae bacterium]
MIRFSIAVLAALSCAGGALAEAPAAKPGKPGKEAAKVNRVHYDCEGGVALTITYPPAALAKTRPVKVALKDTTYFVRPAKAEDGATFENAKIKMVLHTKGSEAMLEREGKPLADKCKAKQ